MQLDLSPFQIQLTLDDLPDNLLRVIMTIYSDASREFNNLRLVSKRLEGCPIGLKCLDIGYGGSIQSLEPLRRCTELEIFIQWDARSISDLSPLAACNSATAQ